MFKTFFLFFILVSHSLIFAQKIEINYNLSYTYDSGKELILSVSELNSNILLLNHLELKQKFLHFDEYVSKISLDNKNNINYNVLKFTPLNYLNRNYSIQLIDISETKVDNYYCTKYTIKVDCNKIYEIFITKHKIDNTMLIYFDIPTKIKTIFKPGLIVRVNSRNEAGTTSKNLLNLENIQEINNSKIRVDIGEIKRKIGIRE